MHNKWLHTWFLGIITIFIIAPLAGVIGWGITKDIGWFWILFWFYIGMGGLCIIIDSINHIRSHRGLFEHSKGCYSLKFFNKEREKTDYS